MATTTTLITDGTAVYHTITTEDAVSVLLTGTFNGARIRVARDYGAASPETYQLLPREANGILTKEGVYKYDMGPGTVLRFQAQDVGSPAPSLRLTTTDA